MDETIPESDHMNIPYLPATQQKIAQFLTTQFTLTPPVQPEPEPEPQAQPELKQQTQPDDTPTVA
jgi:hypothetical protein